MTFFSSPPFNLIHDLTLKSKTITHTDKNDRRQICKNKILTQFFSDWLKAKNFNNNVQRLDFFFVKLSKAKTNASKLQKISKNNYNMYNFVMNTVIAFAAFRIVNYTLPFLFGIRQSLCSFFLAGKFLIMDKI